LQVVPTCSALARGGLALGGGGAFRFVVRGPRVVAAEFGEGSAPPDRVVTR
jgi:hypothetical protein